MSISKLREQAQRLVTRDGKCTQAEFAAFAGVATSTLSGWLTFATQKGKKGRTEQLKVPPDHFWDALTRWLEDDSRAGDLRRATEEEAALTAQSAPSQCVRVIDYAACGPSRFIVSLFERMLTLAGGRARLMPHPKLIDLNVALAESSSTEIVLGHLATLNRLSTQYFFCTPIAVGIGMLLYVGKQQHSRSELYRETVTRAIDGDVDAARQIRIVAVQDEIGWLYASSAFKGSSVYTVQSLSASALIYELKREVKNAPPISLLCADELTCLDVLLSTELLPGHAMLVRAGESERPRYPFGFSVARDSTELKWLKAAWEFYLQVDAEFIAKRYQLLYRDVEAEAERANQRARGTLDSGWPGLLLGLQPRRASSRLVSDSWQRILGRVAL